MLELTSQQRDIRQAAREFAQREFADIAVECDEHETFPVTAWKRASELGFIGAFIEEPYSGAGLGMLECAIILEEFWRIDPGCGNVLLSTLGAEYINDFGSHTQKEKYLPPLARAESMIGTIPSRGYMDNTFFYSTVGESQYILNGSGGFMINGTTADHLVIIAERHGERSTFLVDKKQKGIKTTKFYDKLGTRATNICSVIFDDVTVPASTLIGNEGQGHSQLNNFFDRLCIYNSAQAIGASQGCLERAIKYSRQRKQFGHPIGWFQMVQFKLAEIATRIEASRCLCYQAARHFDGGQKDAKMLSMASWFSRETAGISASETLQIHGGYGYMKELDIERFYRDVQFLNLFGALQETDKLRVAEELLGKLLFADRGKGL